jgi:hypothetical protein
MPAAVGEKRLSRTSLAEAATALERAGPSGAAAALQGATLALEHHLDALAKDRKDRLEPWLQPRADASETKLRETLLLAWDAKRQLAAGNGPDLRGLARSIRQLASDEWDIVFAALDSLGGET